MKINTLKSAALASTLAIASSFASTSLFAEGDISGAAAGAYSLDPTHAYLQFQYNHLGLSNPILTFDDFNIDLNLDPADPAKSTIEVSIVADSVQTGSDVWHDHITGEKWFDTANNPEMTFTSTSITGSGGSFQVTGNLTIKGETKPATLDVVINAAKVHPMKEKPVIGITATGKVVRSDWGLGANAPFVSDEVLLRVEAELIQG